MEDSVSVTLGGEEEDRERVKGTSTLVITVWGVATFTLVTPPSAAKSYKEEIVIVTVF